MKSELEGFIAKYAKFSETDLGEVASRFRKKSVRKADYLLRPGDVCNDLIYVSSGCLRLHYLKDDIEVSVWFSFPQSSAIEIYSFISGNPSNYFLQAVEDSEVYTLPKSELIKLCNAHPVMQVMMKNFWEDVILNLIPRFTALQTDTAEQRYLDLLKKPGYMEAIPQKYLASFIGVTPTSLSRIRKQVAKRH